MAHTDNEDDQHKHSTPPAHPPLIRATAHALAQLHTALSALAFGSALAVGLALHHRKIVKNQYYGWPHEWFPSVSATIGDWFPERNLFQLLIALTSGPRFAVVVVAFLAHTQARPGSYLPGVLAATAVLRTLACGGWVFVTSSDHGDAHDLAMVLYIVLNLPYMVLSTLLTPSDHPAKSPRRWLGSTFFATLVPLVYWYLQHKAHRVAGAYSIYALFEWSLIVLDVSFDACFILDFSASPSSPSSSASSITPLSLAVLPTPAPASAPAAPPSATEAEKKGAWRALARLEMATAPARHLAADVYLAFVFWTLLVGLGPMIFYNSVWAMGLDGREALLLSVLSPLLLSLPPLLSLSQHPAFGNLGALLGLAARYVEDWEGDGKRRLAVVAAGVGWGTMGVVGGWWKARRVGRVEAKASTFLLGLLLSVVVKYANFSLNPLWAFMRSAPGDIKHDNGGFNGVGLVLGLAAYVDSVLRRERAVLPARKAGEEEEAKKGGWAAQAAAVIGFGSLFFLLHWLYTDSGTLLAWTFVGHPSTLPSPFPWGGLVVLSFLCAGAVLPSFVPSAAITSPHLYTAATAAGAALHAFSSWGGLLPACLLGTYALALFPSFLLSLLARSRRPGLPFAAAFGWYALLELASTWTVAYAFVPAGWLLRERTDVVLALVLGGIGVGLVPLRLSLSPSPSASSSPAAPASSSFAAPRALRLRLVLSLSLLLLLALSSALYRLSSGGIPSWARPVDGAYNAADRVVTAGIWTVHFGLDGRMWDSGRRMARLFREAEVDVVGLLETDVHRIVGGNRDLTQFISHALKMPYVDLGPGPNKNTWGCALISKFPILRSSHHLLPSPSGELAPAIFATLLIHKVEVDVVVAHNGQEEDPLDRELQSRELARLMSREPGRPTVFLGYLVTKPHAPRPAPYRFIMEDGKMLDIKSNDHDRWCQYIAYRGLHRVGYARLQRGANPSVTDSEIQLGKFVVPLPSSSSTSSPSSSSSTNLTSPIPLPAYVTYLHHLRAPLTSDPTVWAPERYLPPSLRFPARFGGRTEEEHLGSYYIILNGETGAPGPNYFMGWGEKEVRRLVEVDEIRAREKREKEEREALERKRQEKLEREAEELKKMVEDGGCPVQ
ncbi:hypothetical protein JCM10207_003995 [Rhodosporidiobolus poonsookiae]